MKQVSSGSSTLLPLTWSRLVAGPAQSINQSINHLPASCMLESCGNHHGERRTGLPATCRALQRLVRHASSANSAPMDESFRIDCRPDHSTSILPPFISFLARRVSISVNTYLPIVTQAKIRQALDTCRCDPRSSPRMNSDEPVRPQAPAAPYFYTSVAG